MCEFLGSFVSDPKKFQVSLRNSHISLSKYQWPELLTLAVPGLSTKCPVGYTFGYLYSIHFSLHNIAEVQE